METPGIDALEREERHRGNGADGEILAELAALSPLEYDRRREAAAESLGVRVTTLDGEVARLRIDPEASKDAAPFMGLWRVEPWPDPVATGELLDAIAGTVGRYIVLGDAAIDAVTLWCLHAWAHDAARVSPLLAITSPEKRCGKTRLLGVLRMLTPRPLPAANITAAALFRAVERWRPTLLVDEADTFLDERDELRGLLNSGHTRDTAAAIRVVGDDHEPRMFSTWAPKAIALIGRLHDTLADRSIPIEMRRRLPGETVERLREDAADRYFETRRRAARWAADSLDALRHADPEIPPGLHDRAADSWGPLLAIADAAGGAWPARARRAAVELSGDDGCDETSVRVLLLGDLRDLFLELGERITSAAIVERLVAMEERPWPEWHRGRPMTPRQVARLLAPFGVGPKAIRLPSEGVGKGYIMADFEEVFARYLPSDRLHGYNPHGARPSADSPSVTIEPCNRSENGREPVPDKACNRVTDGAPGPEEEWWSA